MIAELGGEFMYGGTGIDTINLTRWSGDYVVDLRTGSSNYGSETYQEFENLTSGAGNDSLTGTDGANILTSTAGNDTVYGLNGNDIIRGGIGNDTLRGGVGNDALTGGDGKDYLFGGPDADTFIYNLTSDSTLGANCDVLQSGNGGAAFDGAGAAAGDRFDFTNLGNLNFGGTDLGSIWFANVGSDTHCYVNTTGNATAELDIRIIDAGVLASAYTAADALFV